jgi:hypothetical protein
MVKLQKAKHKQSKFQGACPKSEFNSIPLAPICYWRCTVIAGKLLFGDGALLENFVDRMKNAGGTHSVF